MDGQWVEKYGATLYCRDLSINISNLLTLIVFVVFFVEHVPIFFCLKSCLRLNCGLNPVPILFFKNLKDVFN